MPTMSAYAASALERECCQMAAATAGRNNRLNKAAFVIGQLVGAAEIERHVAEWRLLAAAEASGYVRKHTARRARSTIKSGLDCGEGKPRDARHCGNWRTIEVSRGRKPFSTSDSARRALAVFLWSLRKSVVGSPAEAYLRKSRGYFGPVPATLGYLPARDGHAHALIAAFGLASEPEPGILATADADVLGVHITRLAPDGTAKAGTDNDKIMIGRSLGSPIVLAPPNDGLGLAITEGIEDALSIHGVTGLGAWAAGAAGRLRALSDAVPSFIDCCTVVGHDDEAGKRGADELVGVLRARGLETKPTFLKGGA
jgi:hypothetical protein